MEEDRPSTARERAAERRYAEAVSAVLRDFDKSAEWADLLKYLTLLGKTLAKYPEQRFLPEPLLLSRRLAQCLNPALPAGIHSAALKLLRSCLERIGPKQHAAYLNVGMGVFSAFRAASTGVRGEILDLIADFYLPLGQDLAPAATPLVFALLAGIEETNSEHYARAFDTLDAARAAVGYDPFYRALWLALLRAPHLRLPALHYLARRLPQPPKQGPIDSFFAPDAVAARSKAYAEYKSLLVTCIPDGNGLVVSALEQSLTDEQVLVQRETLELLNSHFRLDMAVFAPEKLPGLVRSVLLLLIRREVSLNRRVFAWLLGFDTSNLAISQKQTDMIPATTKSFFSQYACAAVTDALCSLFQFSLQKKTVPTSIPTDGVKPVPTSPDTSAAFLLRPIRILEILLDKEQIATQIITDVMDCAITMFCAFRPDGKLSATVPTATEVLNGVQAFFDMLEVRTLWDNLCAFADKIISSMHGDAATIHPFAEDACCTDNITFLTSIFDNLSLPEDEDDVMDLLSLFYPKFLLTVEKYLSVFLSRGARALNDILKLLQLMTKIIGKIPSPNAKKSEIINFSRSVPLSRSNSFSENNPEPNRDTMNQVLDIYDTYFGELFESVCNGSADDALWNQVFNASTRLLVEMNLRFLPSGTPVREDTLPWCRRLRLACLSSNAEISVPSIKMFLKFLSQAQSCSLSLDMDCTETYKDIFAVLWKQLDVSIPKFHFNAAILLLRLEYLSPAIVNGQISSLMNTGPKDDRLQAYQRFMLLWNICSEISAVYNPHPFGHILFLMLDSLSNEDPQIHLLGRTWLLDNIEKPERVLDPLITEVLDMSTARTVGCTYTSSFDTRRVCYILGQLMVLFDGNFATFSESALKKNASKEVLDLFYRHTSMCGEFENFAVIQYFDLVCALCLLFIHSTFPQETERELVESNSLIQISAAALLNKLLSGSGDGLLQEKTKSSTVIRQHVLCELAVAVSSSNLTLQVYLLTLLRTMIKLDAANQQDETMSLMELPMFGQTLLSGLLQPFQGMSLRTSWFDFLVETLTSSRCTDKLRQTIVDMSIDALFTIMDEISPEFYFTSTSFSTISLVIKTLAAIITKELALLPESDFDKPQKRTNGRKQSNASSFNSTMLVTPQPSTETEEKDDTAESAINRNFVNIVNDGFMMSVTPLAMTSSGGNFFQMLKQAWDATFSDETSKEENMFTMIHSKMERLIESLVKVYACPTSQANVKAATVQSRVHNKFVLQDQILKFFDSIAVAFPVAFIQAMFLMWSSDTVACKKDVLDILYTAENVSCVTVSKASSIIFSSFVCKKERQSPEGSCCNPTKQEYLMLDFLMSYIQSLSTSTSLAESWQYFFSICKAALSSLPPCDYVEKVLQMVHLILSRMQAYEVQRNIRVPGPEKKERQEAVTRIYETLTGLSSQPDIANEMCVEFLSLLKSLGTYFFPAAMLAADDIEKVVPMLSSLVGQLVQISKKNDGMLALTVSALVQKTFDYSFSTRLWKKGVLESFQSDVFFSSGPTSLSMWSPIVNYLMINDKLVFSEMMKNSLKVLQAQQPIFGRDKDALNRAKTLRRLMYAILCGEVDQYQQNLPGLRERIVEALKLPNAPVLAAQAMLGIRVLFVRFSPSLLIPFLPVVLAEVAGALDSQTDVKKDMDVVLAALKLLDTMILTCGAESAFFEWMFVLEGKGMKSHPFKTFIQRLEDRLEEEIDEGVVVSTKVQFDDPFKTELARPLITLQNPHSNETKAQMLAVIKRLGWCLSGNQIGCKTPDYTAINRLILSDMCALADEKTVSSPSSPVPQITSPILPASRPPKSDEEEAESTDAEQDLK